MKKYLLFLCIPLLGFAQLDKTKYLTEPDSTLIFTSQGPFEITVIDTAEVDTLVLEKRGLSTTWATVATISLGTGAYVTSIIGAGTLGQAIYFVKEDPIGYYQIRMTDTAPATVAAMKVKVVSKP